MKITGLDCSTLVFVPDTLTLTSNLRVVTRVAALKF